MAKSEVFKNKITKAQEDLFKSIDAEKAKKKLLSDKIVQELAKLEKSNVRQLNSLNKEYLDECSKNNASLQFFIDTIAELNEELQTSISDYNTYCEERDELTNLKEKNEKDKVVLKNKFKREIQDINIKIDRIEKELQETLAANDDTFNEELTTYKSKIIEFDKRKRFEVSKIQNNTVKEYDELQKLLLSENKKSEIKAINKKIKQIRYNGIIEEKECIFRHLAEQRQFELDFIKKEHEYKCANAKLKEEYNLKVEDTKFDRSMIEFNFKKNEISNDNNLKHTYNEAQKQFKLEHHDKVEDLHKLINEKTLEQLAFEYKKIDSETAITKKIYQGIEENESKQATKFMENANKELTLINKDIALFQKNINFTVTFYVQNIINLYTNYFKNFVLKEETFINSLMVNNVKGAFLQGNSYEEYAARVKVVFETFHSKEEELIESFTSYLSMTLHNFIDQIESFINTIMLLNTNITDIMTNYHKEINAIISEATPKGFAFVEAIQVKTKEEIGAKEYDNKLLFEQRTKKSAEDKAAIFKEYEENEKDVQSTRQAQEVEFKAENSELEKVRNNEKIAIQTLLANELNGFNKEYESKIKSINTRFDDEIKSIEKEYKQKIGLL